MNLAWKTLMQCHAHDSTHGIGVPKIVADSLGRIAQALEMVEGVATRAFQGIIRQIDTSKAEDNDILITVFNPTAYPRSEVVRLFVELPRGENIADWHLEDMDGNRVPMFKFCEQDQNVASINHENRPKALYITRVDVDAEMCDVPAYGYKTYRMRRKCLKNLLEGKAFPNPIDPFRPLGAMPNCMENEFLKVTILPNGTVDVLDKQSGKATKGLNLLLDTGDAGDMWIHRKPLENSIVSNLGANADIRLTRNSGIAATFRVEYTLDIPESLTANRTARSKHAASVKFTTDITLRKNSRRLDFKMHFNNTCKDHMLTVRFPAGIETDMLVSDVAFEVRERPVEFMTDNNGVRGDELRRQPKFRFVDISDGKNGLAVFGKGQNEYEPHQFEDGAGVELTLMRAVTQRFPVHYDVFFEFEKEASQSQGEHTFEYALYFHPGDHKEGCVQKEAQQYITPITAAQFGKGRFAGTLPLEQGSFLSVKNPLTNVSAVKLAEDRSDALVVRINNPTDEVIEETLTFLQPVKKTLLCNMNEEVIEEIPMVGNSVPLSLAPYKIITVMAEF